MVPVWGVALLQRVKKTGVYRAADTALARAVRRAGFRKIVSEFFLEVGVLWFVFPILDTVVQFGTKHVTWGIALLSIGVAVGCLLLAGWFDPKDEAGR